MVIVQMNPKIEKIYLLPILFIPILFLTGCWSSRELNELSIATAIGIDKCEEGYFVTVQLLNPSELAAQKQIAGRAPVTIHQVQAESIFEGLRKLTQQTPRKIYVSHVRVIIIGEALAREGISDILDFLSRDHEFRTDFFILVARATNAEDILSVLTPMEKTPANKIYSSLEMSEGNWAPTKTVQLDELVTSLISDGENPVITGIVLKGDKETSGEQSNVQTINPHTTVEVGNLAVFKEDRLVGWLNTFESIGYNHIDENIKSTVLTFPFETSTGTIAVELNKSNTKVKVKIQDGKPRIQINVNAEGNIGEIAQKIDLNNTDVIKKIEEKLAQEIKMKIEMVINTAQNEFKSDIFGFGQAIYREYPKLWNKIKENWDDEFENLPVDIKVEAKIKGLGTITNSFIQDMKE